MKRKTLKSVGGKFQEKKTHQFSVLSLVKFIPRRKMRGSKGAKPRH
jgi:hypothetical protein